MHHSLMGYYATSQIDPIVHKEMVQIENDGIMNETIVFFMADHGLHFGPHLETFEGQIEHKFPMLYVIAPKWWVNKHPNIAEALALNQNSLVTSFDIHRTIKHITVLPGPAPTLPLASAKKGLSFLDELDPERNCEIAGIPDAYCICEGQGWESLHPSSAIEDPVVQKLLNISIEYFKNKTAQYHSKRPCATDIKLHELVDISRKVLTKSNFVQARRHKVHFTVEPKSKGADGYNLIEALTYERGTGSFEWRSELTGQVDIEHVHRLTGNSQGEVAVGGKQSQYCIIPEKTAAVAEDKKA